MLPLIPPPCTPNLPGKSRRNACEPARRLTNVQTFLILANLTCLHSFEGLPPWWVLRLYCHDAFLYCIPQELALAMETCTLSFKQIKREVSQM